MYWTCRSVLALKPHKSNSDRLRKEREKRGSKTQSWENCLFSFSSKGWCFSAPLIWQITSHQKCSSCLLFVRVCVREKQCSPINTFNSTPNWQKERREGWKKKHQFERLVPTLRRWIIATNLLLSKSRLKEYRGPKVLSMEWAIVIMIRTYLWSQPFSAIQPTPLSVLFQWAAGITTYLAQKEARKWVDTKLWRGNQCQNEF